MLAHDRTGTGEPIVLLHGISHRRQAWQHVVPLLAREYEVIPVDLPGHGESDDLPDDYDGRPAALADAVDAFVVEAGLGRPHVVGNSLGGLVALELASRGTVASATALSPAGFWSNAERLYARALLAGASATMQRMGDDRLRRALGTTAGRTALLGAIVAHPEKLGTDELIGDLNGLAHPRSSFHTMLANMQDWAIPGPGPVPTVVGWGTKDRLLPPHQHRRLRARLPNAEIYSLPGAGHVPMADDPGMVADLARHAARR